MKEIIKDFTREFSVWQQEIEIEANLSAVIKDLGIKCSRFFFFNDETSQITAYRVKSERENLPQSYILLAGIKDFSEILTKKTKPIIAEIKRKSKQIIDGTRNLNSQILKKLRQKLIQLWPAYLFSYNVPRFAQQGIFKPKNKIEKDNLQVAIKLRKLSEGIYDYLETVLQKCLVLQLPKGFFWQKMTAEEIYNFLNNKSITNNISKRKTQFIVDRNGI